MTSQNHAPTVADIASGMAAAVAQPDAALLTACADYEAAAIVIARSNAGEGSPAATMDDLTAHQGAALTASLRLRPVTPAGRLSKLRVAYAALLSVAGDGGIEEAFALAVLCDLLGVAYPPETTAGDGGQDMLWA